MDEDFIRLNVIIDELKCQLEKINQKVYIKNDSKIDLRDRIVELVEENKALKATVVQMAKLLMARKGDEA